MLITIITVVLALSFLVFVHELGHFLAAKKVGVHVIEFSIGFPPKLFSRMIGKTEYMISAIPIGGYVRLKGQGIDDEDENDPENYASKSKAQRFLILVSGAMMNLLVTLILLPIVFVIGYEVPAYLDSQPFISRVEQNSTAALLDIQAGDRIVSVNGNSVNTWREVQSALLDTSQEYTSLTLERNGAQMIRQIKSEQLSNPQGFGWHPSIVPRIGSVASGSPADQSGLKSGDRIVEIDGQPVTDWSQISPLLQQSGGEPVAVSIIRDNQQLDFQIKPQWLADQEYWILGIGSPTTRISENLGQAVVLGVKRVYHLTVRTFEFLFRLISGQEKSESVGGPIMIAKMMGDAAQSGISNVLTLVAFISLQFAIFNLLPIPALDGGHIFLLGIEAVTGKTLSKNMRLSIQRVGFSLLLLLILFISVQDSLRLFTG